MAAENITQTALNAILPIAEQELTEYGRHNFGYVMGCMRNAGSDAIAKDETLRIPYFEGSAAQNIPDGDDIPTFGTPKTPKTVTFQMQKFREHKFTMTGERAYTLARGGALDENTREAMIDAFETLGSEIEADCGNALVQGASFAVGDPGTDIFDGGSVNQLADVEEVAQIAKMRKANRRLFLNPRGLSQALKSPGLQRVNEAGNSDVISNGDIGVLMGNTIRRVSVPISFTQGAAPGAITTSGAANTEGTREITITGGTIANVKAGHVFTIADESHGTKYVATKNGKAGDTTVTIGAPGLREDVPTGKRLTFLGSYKPQGVITNGRGALLGMRPPAAPPGGDSSIDRSTVTDGVTGLTFGMTAYGGRNSIVIFVGAVWGVTVVNSQNIGLLIG